MRIRLVLFTFFLFGLALHGKSDEAKKHLYFKHLTSDDGLSSNRVSCIYEDLDGFIWFGTEDGLNLYDGVSIKVFRNEPSDSSSLSNNAIYSLACNPETGNLWIGTRRGVSCFDKNTYRFENVFKNSSDLQEINGHIINDLNFDDQGGLWMATSFGLYYYNTKSRESATYLHRSNDRTSLAENHVNHVFIDSEKRILISTRTGIDLFNEEKGSFVHLFPHDSLNNVVQIIQDSYGKYWICTDAGGIYSATYKDRFELMKFKGKQNQELNGLRIQSIIEDNSKNLYIAARDKGLYYYDRALDHLFFYEPDSYNSNSLNSKALICSCQSSSGIIWFGTFNRGINYIDNNRKPFEHYRMNYKANGLFNNNVRSFFQDSQGNIWIGTKEGGGLSQFDPESGTFVNYNYNAKASNSFSNDYILCINELDEHTLMLGNLGEGIDLFNKQTHRIANLKVGSSVADNKVYSIFKDRDAVFWVATLNGLFQFNEKAKTFKASEERLLVKCFAQNSLPGLWLGTRFNGLVYYDHGKVSGFTANKSLAAINSGEVTSLRFSSDSVLWIGTINGLHRLNVLTKELKSWNKTDGLSSNRICAIEMDKQGKIWMSTSNGVSRFNPQSGVFKNYFIEDGLQGNDFEMYISLKSKNGDIYFGGGNGFNVFNPEQIQDNLLIPKIHFTNFKIANRSVPIGGKNSPLQHHIDRTTGLTLKHTQADFTFEFVALNYSSPENNRFKYMLEGYDEDWVQAGKSRVATYTNIGAGDYVFKVIGSNNDNIWNTKGRSIKITILPPPWKSKWAYSIYLVVIGLLVMGLYMVIVKRIEQQVLLREERNEREKIELVNQLKLRFFTNISHEFRTPLTLISSPLSKLMSRENLNPSEQRYLYATMNKNVKRLLRLIKQLMDFRKLEDQQLKLKITKGNLSEFVKDIVTGFQEYAENKEVDLIFDMNEADWNDWQWFDRSVMDSVIFNLLSNALKFSPPNKQIVVSLRKEDDWAFIKVIDQGVGIAKDKIDKIFDRFYSESKGLESVTGTGIGLSFTKNLIVLHKGDIHVTSIPEVETCFEVKFSVNKASYSEEEITAGDVRQDTVSSVEELKHSPEEQINESIGEKHKRWSLLIVEDNQELRKFLKNQLTRYTVTEAENGLVALEKARQAMPDLIISDVMMPEMDGVQLCNMLKSDFITSHIPVILLTAKTANEHKIAGMESGADAYIEKPFDMAVLNAQIQNLIKQRNRLRKRFSNHFEIAPSEMVEDHANKKFFEKAERIVGENLSNPAFSVEDFSAALGMSRSQLFRKFKAITDNTPSDYLRVERIKQAKKLLIQQELNINEISLKTGFSSTSHFISTFKKYTGVTPREFRQK